MEIDFLAILEYILSRAFYILLRRFVFFLSQGFVFFAAANNFQTILVPLVNKYTGLFDIDDIFREICLGMGLEFKSNADAVF